MPTVFNHPNELMAAVGQHLGFSDWLTIEQQRINQFADATDDHQWIHVDEQKAKEGPFGQCIAHGYLSLSLVSRFLPEVMQVNNIAMGVNYGCNKARFPAPVPVGARVRGGCELISAEPAKEGVQVVIRVTVEIENSEKPACVVDAISRFYPA